MPVTLSAAPDLRTAIARDAAKCAAAVRREDLATVVSFLPATVVQKSGGRAAMLAELKEQWEEAHRWGADQIEAVPGKPAVPQRIAQWLAAFVPVTAIVHSRYAQLVQETHVLALSSDQGQHWTFVPMYETTQAELNAWFPEFRGKVIVPTAPKPRMSLGN